MCGIAGILSFDQSPVTAVDVKKMTDAILHRGPDGEGQWLNSKQNIGLGHRRLSIIDLSESGQQPMHYANGRYTITFNGEIYNYIELRLELIKDGFVFHSESDTEVLLALFQQKGKDCLKFLDGMFAFAIWDEKEQQLFCARDRFGEKPFFYYLDSTKFLFSSEIKQLLTQVKKETNPQTLYYYLNYSMEGDPSDFKQTFFKDIYRLDPSTCMTVFSNGKLKKEKYWGIELKEPVKISLSDAIEKFNFLFQQSIKRRLRSDVPVGSCLSGGLDSSSIVLTIDDLKSKGHVQKTFSARFKNFEKDEGNFIEEVVKKAKNIEPHSVWLNENDYMDSLEAIIRHQDEPFGGASVVAQYHVMKLAKTNNITVLIDGQGSDEYLAGYTPFFTTYLNQLYGSFSNAYSLEKKMMFEYHGLKHQLSFNGKFLLRYPSLFNTFSGAKKLVSSAKKTTLDKPKSVLSSNFLNSFQFHDNVIGRNDDNLKISLREIITGTGFNSLLRYADRNAMAHSVEVRLPFLSHELVEFGFSLPDNFLIHEGWSKFILRKSLEPLLPEKITWRKDKIGFAAPQDKWLENDISKKLVTDAKQYLLSHDVLSKEGGKDIDPWKSIMTYYLLK